MERKNIWKDKIDKIMDELESKPYLLEYAFNNWETEIKFKWGSIHIIKEWDKYALKRVNLSREEYLKEELKDAIWKENYEKAAEVRDEIKEKEERGITVREMTHAVFDIFNWKR